MPRWRKTMNLSISCFITALIIITAAMLLVSKGVNHHLRLEAALSSAVHYSS